jgi:hypothetical protein
MNADFALSNGRYKVATILATHRTSYVISVVHVDKELPV